MTAAEYQRLYNIAFKNVSNIQKDVLVKMREVYDQAIADVIKEIERYTNAGYSQLTSGMLTNIYDQLKRSSRKINEILEDELYGSVRELSGDITTVDEMYLIDMVGLSDGKLSETGIQNLFVGISDKTVISMVNRIYQDGYTFSQRVWNVGDDFQFVIKDILTKGISAGRDAIDIAKDLNIYVKKGKDALITRWGDFTSDLAAFGKRIRGNVYYPSLRLVRTELYSSLRETSVLSGELNPACTGLYDWIRTNHTDWRCRCPEFEAGSPYTQEDLPTPEDGVHTNCLCRVMPRVMNGNQFKEDMKQWVNGEDVQYLNDWYNNKYLQVA